MSSFAHNIVVLVIGILIGMFLMGHLWIGYAANNSQWIATRESE